MKKFFSKRIVAFLVTLCMIFSIIPMSAVSTAAAQIDTAQVSGAWSDGARSFGINKIYSTGLVACGAVLKGVAEMTGNEEFQKVASFLNVWVFGGNPTTDLLNSISTMCTQILSEVKQINEKLDIYTADIEKQISETQFTILEQKRDEAWQRDVVDVIKKYNLSNAYETYFNYEALDTSKKTAEAEMSYLVATVYYKTGEADKNGKIYTQDDIKAYQDRLFTKFCEIHGGIDNSLSREKQEEKLFETMCTNGSSMDTIMLNAIKELSDNLVKMNYDSYADACAQTAMQGLVSLADQKDYIIANINQQVLAVTITEMMYQEYLSMRAEYLEKHYSDDDPMWVDYRNDVYGSTSSMNDCFKSMNEHIKNKVENRLSTPLKFSSNVYLSVGQLPSTADLQDVRLENTSYMSSFNSYQDEQPIIDYDGGYNYGDITSNANSTSKYMSFQKLPVYTQNGIEMYYIYTDEEFNKNNGTPKLVYGEFYVGNDRFLPSCDFFNLLRGNYTDGVNSFVSPSLPTDEAALFSTNNYLLCGSVPMNYLNKYYSNYSDKALYQIFSTYEYTQNGAFRDSHANFAVINMKNTAPSFNLSFSEQTKISAQDSYEGYDEFADSYYYTVILKNSSTSGYKGTTPTLLQNKLNFGFAGRYDVDMVVEKSSDHSVVSNGSNVFCGEPLTLKFKATNDCTEFVSLKLIRYNNAEKPDEATSEEVILESFDFETLTQKDGYYYLDINMPYSNAKFVIETKHKLSTNEKGDFIVNDYDDLLLMSEKVNSGDSEYVNGSFVVTNDISCPKNTQWTSPIGTYSSQFSGTFDGQGYKISGLYYNNASSPRTVALFDRTNGATIKNLNLDVDFTTKNSEAAGICLNPSNSLISNCTVSGRIKVSADVEQAPLSVAGIAANNYSSTVIEKCINYCNVDAYSYYVGGITCDNIGVVRNCANMGEIKGYSISFDYMNKTIANVGGIASYNRGSVENCYNTGNIICTKYNNSIISKGTAPVNCYYLNTVASDSRATACTLEQFKSGEVAYLLNQNVEALSWNWFQNIDNSKTADDFPTLNNTQDNAVFKVDRENKTYSNTPNDYLLGDADLDSKVSVMDATIIQMHCAKLYELTGTQLINADVTKDNIISVSDATKIQGYIAGLVSL